LGVDWGHLTVEEAASDEFGSKIRIRGNSGMACVVPAWKLRSLLDAPELIEQRQRGEEYLKKDAELVAALDASILEFARSQR
jgi:hypothetical protein